MSDCDWRQLGDVAEIITGFPFKSNLYAESSEGIRLLRGDNVVQGALRWENAKFWSHSNLIERHGKYWLRCDDVVLAMDRPWIEAGLKTSRVSSLDLPSLLVQRVACLRAKEGVDQAYLASVIASRSFVEYVKGVQTGTAVPHISSRQISEFKFRLPALNEQRAIGSFVRLFDEKIDLSRQINQTLESIAQALFKSWFVYFDPVLDNALAAGNAIPEPLRGRATARQALGDARKPLPEEIRREFPDAFEFRGEMGWVPRGWEAGSILSCAQLLSGGTPKTTVSEYWGGDVLWASAKDVSQCAGVALLSTERKISAAGLENSAAKIIDAFSSVVVSRGATTGRIVALGQAMAINQTCYALQSLTGQPWYLFSKLKQDINRFTVSAHGSVFDTITTRTFESTSVLLPQVAQCSHFEKKIEGVYAAIISRSRSINVLMRLRDTLLPKLLSGELTIPAAEKLAADVL